MQEDKQKKGAEEKKAKEEKKKKPDQKKATASSVTISPPSTNDTTVDSDTIINIDEETTTLTDNWTKVEDKEALVRHARHQPQSPFRKIRSQGRQLIQERRHQTKHKQSTLLPPKTPQQRKRPSAYVPSSVK